MNSDEIQWQEQQLQSQQLQEQQWFYQQLESQIRQLETQLLFEEYARQQQQEELARLSQLERADFERLVSEKEEQQLIELRAKNLKSEYLRQHLGEMNDRNEHNSDGKQPSLTQEYLYFKRHEQAKYEQEDESKRFSYSGTDMYASVPHEEVWYHTRAASEEFQLRLGIIPPLNITPSGAVWMAEFERDSKRLQIEEMVSAEKQRQKSGGFSPEEISKRETAIYKEAFNKVTEEWRSERASRLKTWQESQAEKSFQHFESQEGSVEQRTTVPDSLRAKLEAQREKYGTIERQPEKSQEMEIER